MRQTNLPWFATFKERPARATFRPVKIEQRIVVPIKDRWQIRLGHAFLLSHLVVLAYFASW
jgi:hypothetical protein